MREVFKPAGPPPDPGRVFYTVQPDDVGKTRIETTAEVIPVFAFLGYITKADIGRRLFRVASSAGDRWLWQAESMGQRDKRLGGWEAPRA